MATDTIPPFMQPAKTEAGKAYWDAVCSLELIEVDADRASETAFALATSEAFDSNAQAAFYVMGQLLERLTSRCKKEGARFEGLSNASRGAAQ